MSKVIEPGALFKSRPIQLIFSDFPERAACIALEESLDPTSLSTDKSRLREPECNNALDQGEVRLQIYGSRISLMRLKRMAPSQ